MTALPGAAVAQNPGRLDIGPRSEDILRKNSATSPSAATVSFRSVSAAFASDNDVLRADSAVVDVVAYVEDFRPTSLNVAFWNASLTPE